MSSVSLQGKRKRTRKRERQRGQTDTSVITLSYGTTNALGSVSPQALKTNRSWPTRIRWRVTPGAVLHTRNHFRRVSIWGGVDLYDLSASIIVFRPFNASRIWVVLATRGHAKYVICHYLSLSLGKWVLLYCRGVPAGLTSHIVMTSNQRGFCWGGGDWSTARAVHAYHCLIYFVYISVWPLLHCEVAGKHKAQLCCPIEMIGDGEACK